MKKPREAKESVVEELSDEEMNKVGGAVSLTEISQAYNSYISSLTEAAAGWREAMGELTRSIRG